MTVRTPPSRIQIGSYPAATLAPLTRATGARASWAEPSVHERRTHAVCNQDVRQRLTVTVDDPGDLEPEPLLYERDRRLLPSVNIKRHFVTGVSVDPRPLKILALRPSIKG